MGWFSDAISSVVSPVADIVGGVGDAAQGLVQTAAPYAGLIGAASGIPGGALIGSALGGALGGAGTTAQSRQAYGNLTQGLLGTGSMMQQNKVSQAAAEAAQRQALAGGQTAANMAQFRPVGTTTTFGTSNFTVDPTTGQLTSAGYSLSPQMQAYQNALMSGGQQSLTDAANLQNLGRGYIAQTPEQAAQQYMTNQQALLQPSRDMESARLANQLQQTGRTGVSVAQGGNLGMANPEQQALANARAMQDLQLAAQAQQAGQQQTLFGQGLLTGAYDPFNAGLTASKSVEALGQQPFTLSTDLAKLQAAAGANQGQLYNTGAQRAAAISLLPEMQTSNTATILGGLASPTSQLNSALGGLFGNLGNFGYTGSPTGLDVSNIDYGSLSNIYSGGDPFAGVLGTNETWYGE